MNISEFKNSLSKINEVIIILPNGKFVPPHSMLPNLESYPKTISIVVAPFAKKKLQTFNFGAPTILNIESNHKRLSILLKLPNIPWGLRTLKSKSNTNPIQLGNMDSNSLMVNTSCLPLLLIAWPRRNAESLRNLRLTPILRTAPPLPDAVE